MEELKPEEWIEQNRIKTKTEAIIVNVSADESKRYLEETLKIIFREVPQSVVNSLRDPDYVGMGDAWKKQCEQYNKNFSRAKLYRDHFNNHIKHDNISLIEYNQAILNLAHYQHLKRQAPKFFNGNCIVKFN